MAAMASTSFSAGLRTRPLPTFSEACALVDSRHSRLMVRTLRRPLALSPRYLNKKRSAIEAQLKEDLLRYSPRFKGASVAYDNIKIVGELADIDCDTGYIRLTIEVDFVIFQPKCGKKLVGVVNHVAPTHIGCVVHGWFNASIEKPIEMSDEAWEGLEVKVGDNIKFKVYRLDWNADGVIGIYGKMGKK